MELPLEKFASMSLNGTQPASVARLQVEVSPYSARIAGSTVVTQGADAGFDKYARASAGLTAEGRKKLVSAEEIQSWPVGFVPQGAEPVPTPSGPPTVAPEVGSVMAAA